MDDSRNKAIQRETQLATLFRLYKALGEVIAFTSDAVDAWSTPILIKMQSAVVTAERLEEQIDEILRLTNTPH